jgi:hypothetical protein
VGFGKEAIPRHLVVYDHIGALPADNLDGIAFLSSVSERGFIEQPGGSRLWERYGRNGPTHRIIHLHNWYFVRKADFAADLRSIEGQSLSDDEIDSRYDNFLTDVELVQAEQRQLLKHLIVHHGLKWVYIEGLTKEELPAIQKRIKTLRDFDKHKPMGETPIEQLMLHEYRLDRLEIGAAGQLFLEGELNNLLSAENAAAFTQANPVGDDGKVVFDEKRNATREDAIVRELLKGGPFAVIVLGGGHDLADNAERLSKGTCEVITVSMKAYRKATE